MSPSIHIFGPFTAHTSSEVISVLSGQAFLVDCDQTGRFSGRAQNWGGGLTVAFVFFGEGVSGNRGEKGRFIGERRNGGSHRLDLEATVEDYKVDWNWSAETSSIHTRSPDKSRLTSVVTLSWSLDFAQKAAAERDVITFKSRVSSDTSTLSGTNLSVPLSLPAVMTSSCRCNRLLRKWLCIPHNCLSVDVWWTYSCSPARVFFFPATMIR